MTLPEKNVLHVGIEVFAEATPEHNPLRVFIKEVNNRGFRLGPTDNESCHWHHGTNRICLNILEFFYLADKLAVPMDNGTFEFEAMVGIIGLHELGHAVTTIKILEEGEQKFKTELSQLAATDAEFLHYATELGAWAWAESMLPKDHPYQTLLERLKTHALGTHAATGRAHSAKC